MRAAARRQRQQPKTAAEAPGAVQQLLRSYDPRKLEWTDPRARWAVVGEVITRGGAEAWAWVLSVMSRSEVQELARWARGSGYCDHDRAKIRKKLRLSLKDVPNRPWGCGFHKAEAR
jgi:hypothetical protein